jgi:cyclophilin family peptidyl-prolyl cis-trans isomerase
MARYTPPPGRDDPQARWPTKVIGSQFAITLTTMTHLAGRHTVIGHCADLDRVRAIAARGTAAGRGLPRLKGVQIVSMSEEDLAASAMSVPQ